MKKISSFLLCVFLVAACVPATEVLISETMQRDEVTFQPADGLWVSGEQKIIIRRSVLQSTERFVAVLLHEVAHAISGATDATRRFESELTRLLGIMGTKAVNQ